MPCDMAQLPRDENTWLMLVWKEEKDSPRKARETTHQRNQEDNLQFSCILDDDDGIL